jgi:hypothetical protein
MASPIERETSEELLARWKAAERTFAEVERGTPRADLLRRLADLDWEAYKRRLSEGRQAARDSIVRRAG